MEGEPLPPCRSDPVIMKLDTPEFHSVFTPELNTLAELFKKHNYEIRIAGGAVRDILMGKKPKDVDFATTATPEQMKEMFTKENVRMINTKGERHGTITSRINDKENFEVTTLRIDVVTDGRHAEVEFTTNWKLDANRRDLTFNSMFLGLDGRVYDYFYGYDDLQKKRVAFVGSPATRIQEDYLRILRYFRFYGRIAEEPDKHEEETIKAIEDNGEGLQRISGERIWGEWQKILQGRHARELTKRMISCGLAKYIGLPEQPDLETFDIVSCRAAENKLILRPISLICAMLKNEEQIMQLHMRLKLSAFERDLGLFLVQHREDKPCEQPMKPYQHLVLNAKGKVQDVREFTHEVLRYRGAVELLKEFTEWQPPRFPVTGAMLKTYAPPGKKIGIILTKLKEVWLDEDFKSTSEDLLKHVPRILDEMNEGK